MFKATTLTNSLRSTINTTFSPSLTRSFHASSATMAIKTYFDCQWTGPQITVDDNGKVLSKDDSAVGKSHPTMSLDVDSTVHHGHQRHRGSGVIE